MRIINTLAILLIVCSSCVSQTNLKTVKYPKGKRAAQYYINVPKDYTFEGMSGDHEDEQRYLYKDSSFIYITDFSQTPNYENIKNLGDSILNYRFQNKKLVEEINEAAGKIISEPLPDTLELSGTDEKMLYWKDVVVGNISVGYVGVPSDRKELFDKALKTLRRSK